MPIGRSNFVWVCVLVAGVATPAAAQIYETVGTRAQGMGGAFVAVANDSSATWWNPAGLADGPFLDMAWARSTTDLSPERPGRAAWFALGTPPFGFSYYRLQISDIAVVGPTDGEGGGRQAGVIGVPVRALEVSQLGATVLRTLVTGVHVGSTIKYVRGSVNDGDTDHALDLDAGLLAVAGPVRLGVAGRNLREPEFDAPGGAASLERQVRVGAAFDASQLPGVPLTIALDADVQRYRTATGDRRVVAVGAEQWLFGRRVGVRAGARFNTVGAEEQSATAGVSVAPRPGLYFDGFIVRGGSADDRGWGIGARVSF
jgi:hypothetical protein